MRLYFKFFAMHLKSRMAYKKSFFFAVIGQFLTSFTAFLSMWFLLDRFETVRGYTLEECVLCSGVLLMSFAFGEGFFRGFDRFPRLVRSANFDLMLVRPRNLIFQVLCNDIEFTRIGRILQAVLMLAYGISMSSVVWTPYRALVLTLMILGGACIFAALFIIHAGFSFFTLEGLEFMNVFTDGAKEHFAYPIDVYGKPMLRICTYCIPYALFQYYPLLYLLGRPVSPLNGLLPLLTPLFLIPALALWRFGVKRYKSAGS